MIEYMDMDDMDVQAKIKRLELNVSRFREVAEQLAYRLDAATLRICELERELENSRAQEPCAGAWKDQ